MVHFAAKGSLEKEGLAGAVWAREISGRSPPNTSRNTFVEGDHKPQRKQGPNGKEARSPGVT